MKILFSILSVIPFFACSAFSAQRYLDDWQIQYLEKRWQEQVERREQGIIDHPNNLFLKELSDLEYHYDHQYDSDYNITWETEHNPDNQLSYYITGKGFYVPKGWLGWSAVFCGFVFYFSRLSTFLIFGLFFAVVDLPLCAFYGFYGAGLAWFIDIVIFTRW
jgi:hypothetical protein